MGLEDFTSDDNSSSSSSSSSNTYSQKSESTNVKDGKSVVQSFSKTDEVNPRRIKYQIKSVNAKWVKQFNDWRIDEGEVVYYTGGYGVVNSECALMVLTTIRGLSVEQYDGDEQPIIVAPWNLVENEPVEEVTEIKSSDNWQQNLKVTLREYIERFEELSQDSVSDFIDEFEALQQSVNTNQRQN